MTWFSSFSCSTTFWMKGSNLGWLKSDSTIASPDSGDLDLVTDVTVGPRHTDYESVSHLGEASFFLSVFFWGGCSLVTEKAWVFFPVRWRLFKRNGGWKAFSFPSEHLPSRWGGILCFYHSCIQILYDFVLCMYQDAYSKYDYIFIQQVYLPWKSNHHFL